MREGRGEATRRGPGAQDGGDESAARAGAHPVPAVALDRFGLLCAVLAAVGFSGKAILVKLAYRYGVDAETLLALRMAFSLPFFVVLGGIGARRAPTRLTRRDWGWLFGLGLLGYYLASYLDFLGLQYISAALERLILFVYPTLVQPGPVYALALAMALFSTVLPVWGVAEAIRRLGPGPVAMTGSLGPLVTLLLAWLLLDEALGVAQLIGAALVIAGVTVMARR